MPIRSFPSANGHSGSETTKLAVNRSVLHQRVPQLFTELALTRGDGLYARILRSVSGVQLIDRLVTGVTVEVR